jgi:flagellar hook-associated protein 2
MSSPIRIGGLSSGNDYAGMIKQLMEARQVPITKKEQKLTELDYDLGAWSQVQTVTGELSKSLNDLRSFEMWRTMAAVSTDETVVSATADTGTMEQQYMINVTNMAAAQSISSDPLTTANDLITEGYANAGDIFEIEGQQVTIEAGETLASLRTKINSAALNMAEDVRVRASIVDNYLVLTREKTGAADITLADVSGTTLQNLGVVDALGAIKNERVVGENAEFTVNGIPVVRSGNSQLSDVVSGVTLELRNEGLIMLDVRPDREAMKAGIQTFVEKYNALAELLDEYGKIVMGGSSELAQKGELYGDSMLNSLKNNLRKMATAVKSPALNVLNASYTYKGNNGIMDSLGDIGIWTAGERNRLEVQDEAKLDYLLEHEFDKVEQLFKGTYNATEVAYTDGIASDFYKYTNRVSESLTGDIALRIEALTKRFDDLSEDIDEMKLDLEDYEQKQWDIFTIMENSLAKMKDQTAYINSVFGGKK